MSEKVTLLRKGKGRQEFERVADSHSLDELRSQLGALDPSILSERPVLVVLDSEDLFAIFSSTKGNGICTD